MKLAETIQRLRRAKGLSQEQLAEQIGVSRQAVSKWESAQAVPDVEKVLLLSEFFGVTTDELLKGEAPPQTERSTDAPDTPADDPAQPPKKPVTLAVAGTALNAAGLLTALLLCVLLAQTLGYFFAGMTATMAGALLMVAGCAVLAAGALTAPTPARRLLLERFGVVNGWLLGYLPLVSVYNRLALGMDYYFVGYRSMPLPAPARLGEVVVVWPQWLFWLVYLALGAAAGTLCVRNGRRPQDRP